MTSCNKMKRTQAHVRGSALHEAYICNVHRRAAAAALTESLRTYHRGMNMYMPQAKCWRFYPIRSMLTYWMPSGVTFNMLCKAKGCMSAPAAPCSRDVMSLHGTLQRDYQD